jgi:LAO/AO transport system kinase
MLKKRLIEEVLENLTETGQFDQAVDSIVEGKIDPYSACDELVLPAIEVLTGESGKG